MPFDLAMVKRHPYAIGGVVVVGALFVFYEMSKGGSTAVVSSNPASDYLSAQAAIGQAQAAAAIQTNAQNAALQTAQINASAANYQSDLSAQVANTQTLAQLAATLNTNKNSLEVVQSNNEAATAQQSATLKAQTDIYSIQESGLMAQINQAEQENANNNATSLAALKEQLGYQSDVAGLAANLTSEQLAYQNELSKQVLSNAGKSYNTQGDANRATALEQTILSGGNPSVAASGDQFLSQTGTASTYGTASIINSLSSGISNVVRSVF